MCSYLLKRLNIILQEFQYGKDVFQTTTNKERGITMCYELRCLLVGSRLYVQTSLFGYGNIEW